MDDDNEKNHLFSGPQPNKLDWFIWMILLIVMPFVVCPCLMKGM